MVKGRKGELTVLLPPAIKAVQEGDTLIVKKQSKGNDALHGLARATLANAVAGVTTGWTKTLELVGVGYRAALSGNDLQLTVGYSHPVVIVAHEGITFAVVEGKVVVSGVNRHLVGQVAANVRAVKPPEPYKGKGIRYLGEHIRKKAGKAAKAVGGSVGGAKS